MKTRHTHLLILTAGIAAFGWNYGSAADQNPVKKVDESTVVQVWKTTSRISETNDSGLVAIPEGVEVKVVEKDGKSFIAYGRTLISMETAKGFIINVSKPVPTTVTNPQMKLEAGSSAPSTATTATSDDVLSKEELEILSKGQPEYNLRERLEPLQSAKITKQAEFRLRSQQISQAEAEISESLRKGRVVANGKTKKAELETQKAQLITEQQRTSHAYNKAYAEIKEKLEKERSAYTNALAKQKRIEEAKQQSAQEKADLPK